MNATTKAIIDRLPGKPILSPGDIAAAYGKVDGAIVIADIKRGKLSANRIGGQFLIARSEAVRYVESNEYTADEA